MDARDFGRNATTVRGARTQGAVRFVEGESRGTGREPATCDIVLSPGPPSTKTSPAPSSGPSTGFYDICFEHLNVVLLEIAATRQTQIKPPGV